MIAYFFIALPGAGKTTYIGKTSTKVISADSLKESHRDYNPNDCEHLHQWSVEEAERLVDDHLQYSTSPFIFDGGGINNSYSKRIMLKAKAAGFKIDLTFIDTPVFECLRRLSLRERKVPVEDVFYKAFKLKSCLEEQKKIADVFTHIKYYTNANIVFDMDGTLVEYVTHPLKCKFAPDKLRIDYINNNIFEYAEPVIPMVEKVKKYADKNIFILSVSPNSETNKQKLNWLSKHLPFINQENVYFVGHSEKKIDVLKQLIRKYKIKPQDLTYVDDLHSMIWEALNSGINAIHPSEFLTTKY